jgi:hypothetical protein
MLLVAPGVATRHHKYAINVPYILGKFKLALGTGEPQILEERTKNKVKFSSHPNCRLQARSIQVRKLRIFLTYSSDIL